MNSKTAGHALERSFRTAAYGFATIFSSHAPEVKQQQHKTRTRQKKGEEQQRRQNEEEGPYQDLRTQTPRIVHRCA